MTVAELRQALEMFPANAEIIAYDHGDPSTGITGYTYTLDAVFSDQHVFVPSELPARNPMGGEERCCEVCDFIESAHTSAPVTVYMKVSD